MNTSRSSTRPTDERSICRCVPSPQSNSSRSPPRRTQQRRRGALGRRDRARGAEEDEVEIHGSESSVGSTQAFSAADPIPDLEDRATPAGTGSNLRAATERSVTLLRVFLVASAAIIAVGGVLLSSILTRTRLRPGGRRQPGQRLPVRRRRAARHPRPGRPGAGQPRHLRPAERRAAAQPRARDGQGLAARRRARLDEPRPGPHRPALRHGRRPRRGDREPRSAVGHIDQLSGDEDAVEESLGYDHLLEVYAPIRSADGRKVLGVYEIYADPKGLEQTLASRRHMIWATVAGVLLALWAALALLVRGASKTLTPADARAARALARRCWTPTSGSRRARSRRSRA